MLLLTKNSSILIAGVMNVAADVLGGKKTLKRSVTSEVDAAKKEIASAIKKSKQLTTHPTAKTKKKKSKERIIGLKIV